jgi:hypothetical protein
MLTVQAVVATGPGTEHEINRRVEEGDVRAQERRLTRVGNEVVDPDFPKKRSAAVERFIADPNFQPAQLGIG